MFPDYIDNMGELRFRVVDEGFLVFDSLMYIDIHYY